MKKWLLALLLVCFTIGIQAQSAAWYKAKTQDLVNALATSAGLAAKLSNETGTGAVVFGTSPSLTTPSITGPITVVGTTIAGIDSFWLALTTDTITATGIAPGDVFTFTEYCPDYDSAVDTVFYNYICETGRVLVSRIGQASGAVYKSRGKYSYIRLDK